MDDSWFNLIVDDDCCITVAMGILPTAIKFELFKFGRSKRY